MNLAHKRTQTNKHIADNTPNVLQVGKKKYSLTAECCKMYTENEAYI